MTPTAALLNVYFEAKRIISAVKEGREVSLDALISCVDSVEAEDVEETKPCAPEQIESKIKKPKSTRKKNESSDKSE